MASSAGPARAIDSVPKACEERAKSKCTRYAFIETGEHQAPRR